MPTKVEKDAITGQDTTGHEWDGLKELNTPLPKWWLYVMYATIAFAVVWWILYPSWPWFNTYFPGILHYSQRKALDERMAEAAKARSGYEKQLAAASLQQIASDPQLMAFAYAGGQAAFNDNCAPCHGLGGAGQHNYPTLADDDWLWGGALDAIETTIKYGIRSGDPKARFNEMPAFGADKMLDQKQIDDVASYVLSLSGQAPGQSQEQAAAVKSGGVIFAEQCAACHGEDGKGNQELGAPNLTDDIWLYGGTKADIVRQIYQPRQGVMPAWVNRLDPVTIKSLAIYVHALGGGK
jgi:cytochrome c oxidase cbb3-type subunit 3